MLKFKFVLLAGRAARVIRYMNKALERGARMVRELQYEGKNVCLENIFILHSYTTYC